MGNESLSMTKREIIFKKYGGKCAYCGCELKKSFHVDHIEPLVRNPVTGGQKYPERNKIDNCNPSCASCNNYKHSMSLEEFRTQIGEFTKRLGNDSKYKIAKRFGLIIEPNNKVKFYFEKFVPSNNVNRQTDFGTVNNIGDLKKIIERYPNDTPFGFRNQPIQTLCDYKDGEFVYVFFQQ